MSVSSGYWRYFTEQDKTKISSWNWHVIVRHKNKYVSMCEALMKRLDLCWRGKMIGCLLSFDYLAFLSSNLHLCPLPTDPLLTGCELLIPCICWTLWSQNFSCLGCGALSFLSFLTWRGLFLSSSSLAYNSKCLSMKGFYF